MLCQDTSCDADIKKESDGAGFYDPVGLITEASSNWTGEPQRNARYGQRLDKAAL
jgi:hypothetical protein